MKIIVNIFEGILFIFIKKKISWRTTKNISKEQKEKKNKVIKKKINKKLFKNTCFKNITNQFFICISFGVRDY